MLQRTAIRSAASLRPAYFSIAAMRPAVTLQQRAASSAPKDDRGAYPDVPFEWYQHRSQYVKYYDEQGRRHFNEPLHKDHDFLDVWSPDRFDTYSNQLAVRNTILFFSAVAAFSGFCYYYLYPERPAAPRSYPHGGLYKALGASEEEKEVYQARVDEGN